MEEMFIERGVSSTTFGKVPYKEITLSIEQNPGVTYGVHSMPNLYEDDKKIRNSEDAQIVLVNLN